MGASGGVNAALSSSADRVHLARAALKEAQVRVGEPRRGWVTPAWPCGPALTTVMPAGLRRGHVISVTGSTSLMLALIAQASGDGAWTAMIGMPQVGVIAAARRGVELARLALIPYPGAQAAATVGACVDGMDVVVVGAHISLSHADRRRVAARARERGSILVVAGEWPGAQTALTVDAHRWNGLGDGEGRLRERQLLVTVRGRAQEPQRHVSLTLDADSGARWVRPGVRQSLDEGAA